MFYKSGFSWLSLVCDVCICVDLTQHSNYRQAVIEHFLTVDTLANLLSKMPFV